MPYRVLDPSLAAAAPVVTAGAPLTSVGETLFTLREELMLQTGSRSDVDTSRFDRWINWAYRNLAGMVKIAELKSSYTFNLVSAQPFYKLPAAVRSVRGLSVIDGTYFVNGGQMLLLSDEDEYRRQPNLTGYPQNYFRYNRMLVVYPDPVVTSAMSLDYWLRPDLLVEDDDSPILPVEFHEPLLLHARHRAWRSLQEFQKANLAVNDFLQAFRPLIDTDAEETAESPRGLTVARKASDLTRARR